MSSTILDRANEPGDQLLRDHVAAISAEADALLVIGATPEDIERVKQEVETLRSYVASSFCSLLLHVPCKIGASRLESSMYALLDDSIPSLKLERRFILARVLGRLRYAASLDEDISQWSRLDHIYRRVISDEGNTSPWWSPWGWLRRLRRKQAA